MTNVVREGQSALGKSDLEVNLEEVAGGEPETSMGPAPNCGGCGRCGGCGHCSCGGCGCGGCGCGHCGCGHCGCRCR